MTKEDVIEILERFVLGAKPCSQIEIIDACASAYRMLKEQPSLPSDLDEVAKKQAETIYPKIIRTGHVAEHDVNLLTRRGFKKGFKAGAEWMAGQGVTVKKKIGKIDDGINQIPTYCNGFEITELDVPFLNSKKCADWSIRCYRTCIL